MIAEILTLWAYALGGALVAYLLGMRSWRAYPFGLIVGLGLAMLVTLVQVAAHLPTTPWVPISVVGGGSVACWALARLRGSVPAPAVRWVLPAMLAIPAFIAIVRATRQVTWHVDSLVYLKVAALLAHNHYQESTDDYLLTKRLIGVATLHAPASISGDWYLPTITPLIALATLAIVSAVAYSAAAPNFTRLQALGTAGLAIGCLLASSRFWYHALYLNGHLLAGVAALAAAVAAWHLWNDPQQSRAAWLAVIAMAMAVMVLTRPEGFLFGVLVIVPMILYPGVPVAAGRIALLSLGATSLVWHGYVVATIVSTAGEVGMEVVGGIGVGVMACVFAAFPRLWPPRDVKALGAIEASAWVVLAGLAILNAKILSESLRSGYRNIVLGKGGWGLGFTAIALAVVAVAILYRAAGSALLRFAVTMFVPFVLTLAVLRGHAYRIGEGDSLNRMAIQVVPLALAFIAVVIGSGRLRWWTGSRPAKGATVAE